MNGLAFTPLYDPLTAPLPWLSNYWLLLVLPLVIAIAIIYKGTRIPRLGDLPRAVIIWSFQVIVAMAVAAGVLTGVYWVWIRAW